ncbi:MAG: DMT family transporter [Castellaniella sp.]|nr:DMT family transporter [Castellaniella sp.]
MSTTTKAYLQLHLCVILWGFTPIFGRLISLDALSLVWWRMLITGIALLALPSVRHQLRRMPWRLTGAYAAIGLLLAVSWLLFYGAIKLSNASVGAICLAAGPIFLAIIEPLITRRPFNARELLLGVALIPGMALIVGGIPSDMYLGLAVGLASAFFLAAFSVFNKRMVDRAGALVVTGTEMTAGALSLMVIAPFIPHTGAALQLPGWQDAWLLAVFAVGCTLAPFVLLMKVLRHISAFTMQMATNLEPVYAILIAIPLLGEQMELSPLFYLGVVVVIGAVILQPIIVRGKV